ncbi:hypothetical protein BC351_31490 [Paenibacillus ferrarius]|uniref:Uncharacterized protein n=1 Tax=Paenibacillus ferrarius TaxID=1469647 RepID=A0A1V4HGX2_9BACL|nr:hypothetical protein [Paenibacillus ferrarius]OPH54507.1 hypothetical protein BC351_31490 [Paenibacillus ferrarius]
MKRTYKFTEIAGKIGKPRAAVMEWSNDFREFLPTKAIGGSLRYTEEAIEIFEIIAKLSDANKPLKWIKEHLREMRQKAANALHDEKPLSPIPTVVPDSNLSPSADHSISPPAMNNSNLQLSKETMDLSHMVQLLTQKIEANKSPMNGMEQVDDLNQKVGISSLASGGRLLPMLDQSKTQFVQLSNEVAELSNIIETIKSKVTEVSGLSEEVTELRNVIQILTHHVVNLFEQDTRSEVAATLVFLHREIESAAIEVKGLKNVIETVQQKVVEVSLRDLQGEILASTTELLNRRCESTSLDIQNLYKVNHLHTQKATELQNVIETVQQKVVEVSERDLRGEILTSTTELLNQRDESISLEIQNLHKGNHLHTQKVVELQNVIETVQQKVAEVSQRDLQGEILVSTRELLNQRDESISLEIQNLHKVNHLHTQKVTELQNVIETVQQKVVEVSERDLRGEVLASTTELLNQRDESISLEIQNLHKGNHLHTQKATELQNVIETLQQKVVEVSERDLRGEILTSATELLNQRDESISLEIQNLHKGNHLHTQKVTELQNVIETVQQKVVEVSERDLRGEILTSTTELVNQRYDEMSQQLISQQRLLDKIAKILGF